MRDLFVVALSAVCFLAVPGLPASASTQGAEGLSQQATAASRRTQAQLPLVAPRPPDPELMSPTGDLVPGPYYVDFRARTAASYGHAFTWFGKSTQREVDVAGLHPATDSVVPYLLGHVMWVKSETGASYGDLDEQYLTANYRVYLSAEDAPKVFAYIRKLQATTPFWNAGTTNCIWFIGQIADYMGLKTPSQFMSPEEYVNELKKVNNGVQMAHLAPSQ
ncbi:hypothetical protein [Ancylobacter gelatini]|uniref:hypothetical protein n=1 Tax=Ancylobacter gelatini TaxID=2919920 RepID=UPI003CC962CC